MWCRLRIGVRSESTDLLLNPYFVSVGLSQKRLAYCPDPSLSCSNMVVLADYLRQLFMSPWLASNCLCLLSADYRCVLVPHQAYIMFKTRSGMMLIMLC